MSKRYQVVAECAHVLVTDHSGVKATHLLYKGAFLPEEVDADRLKFLIDGGFVAEEGETPVAPNAAVDQDPRTGADSVSTEKLRGQSDEQIEAARREAEEKAKADSDAAKADQELAEKRAAAQAKLPPDGSLPDGRLGQPVWVEFLVKSGSSYDDVRDAEKDELIKLAKQRQQ